MKTFCECGGTIIVNNTPKPPHYAEYRCQKCSKWHGYIPAPEERRKKSTIKNTYKIHGKKCAFCEQTEEDLTGGNFLSIDHQQELTHDGKDETNNTWVLCDACHKLKNWIIIHARNKYVPLKREE